MIEAADGALIPVGSQGLRHAPADVMATLTRGEKVDPALIYFRTVIRFETAAPAHDALNRSLFLSVGERRPDAVVLQLSAL